MKAHSKNIDGIEALRGVAALMVLFYHLVELLKVPLPGSLGFIRSHFGMGVPLFYALSGFVLAYGYSGRLNTPDEIKFFYLRRLCRIAPLFYAMLLAWLIVNWLIWHAHPSFTSVLLNITFLFGLVPGMHESIVWAGWSIGIEMLFYAIFPIAATLITNVRTAGLSLILGCILSGATYGALSASNLGNYAYMNLVTHLPNFLCGVFAYHLWARANFRSSAWGAVLFVAALIISVLLVKEPRIYIWLAGLHFAYIQQNIWVVVFCMLILSACMIQNPLLTKGPLRDMGRVSFSMYLVHPMLMLAFMKLRFVEFLKSQFQSVSIQFLIGTIVTVGTIWLVSSITYRFIEKPGIALGRRLTRKVNAIRTCETGLVETVASSQDQYAG